MDPSSFTKRIQRSDSMAAASAVGVGRGLYFFMREKFFNERETIGRMDLAVL